MCPGEHKNFVKLKETHLFNLVTNCLYEMKNQERYRYQIFGADDYSDVIKNFQ